MEEPHREFVKGFHQAAETGDVEQIQLLLNGLEAGKRNFRLSSVEESTGELPCHGAARGGHREILELLLPETLQHLIDTPSKQGGWSCLHLAAAYGHVKVVQWLCAERRADFNLQAKEGNTPMHLAVVLGHKDVVRFLVTAGANLFSRNKDNMMPFSLCKDQAMFEALFSNYTSGSTSCNKAQPAVHSSWPLDAEGRSFLHYTAQFAKDPNGIARLISELSMDQLQGRDERGDTFLHVAAKSGKTEVLQALRKVDADINQLVSISGCDPRTLNPGLCALLNNQQKFFDELIAISEVKITLRCIIQGLMAELIDKPKIQDRLALFADTLPTYLALYANKTCIFKFLLDSEIVKLSQWDDERKRTCLHWAVLHNRIDIVEHLSGDAQLRPGIQDADGKTAIQYAFEQRNHMMMDTLRSKCGFKDYEEKLDRDREIYVQALNAILVGAALIASVTFAGWLQLPSTSFHTLGMKIFWASNCVSFFTAVATMCVSTTALIPTPRKYVGDIVSQLHVAIVMDAGLLALSLVAVMWAFAAAGFSALHAVHTFSYQGIMRGTTAVGGALCFIMWMAFVFQLYICAPPRSVLFGLVFPSVPPSFFSNPWCPAIFQKGRTRIGASSRFGYVSKSRSDLRSDMGADLVARLLARDPGLGTHVSPSASTIPLHTMQEILGKFVDIENTGRVFLEHIYKQKEGEIAYKRRKEGVNALILRDFDVARTVA